MWLKCKLIPHILVPRKNWVSETVLMTQLPIAKNCISGDRTRGNRVMLGQGVLLYTCMQDIETPSKIEGHYSPICLKKLASKCDLLTKS